MPLPKWVTDEPVYVTLVEVRPDEPRTTILVERPMNLIPRTRMYEPVAFVISFSEGVISINGEIEDLAEEAMRLCSLCDEATTALSEPGQGYYSDPDAS